MNTINYKFRRRNIRQRFSDSVISAARFNLVPIGRGLRCLDVFGRGDALAAAVLLLAMVSACSPLYVMRAAYEEGKILWRREPIAQFLEKPDLNPDTQDKLKLVLATREYARNVLNLNVGGSYASYSYVDRPDLTHILTAAPRTELKPYTWWFLIVGRVPYKGFFSKAEALAAADELQAEGYDTNIRSSAAFSTLGWFDDPLLSHLLRFDKVTLAGVVFHELFHNTLYIKGAGDFNESVANFIGGRATIDFFRYRFGETSAELLGAEQAWADELEFSEFIEKLAAELNQLYASAVPHEEKLRVREAIFRRAQMEWEQSRGERFTHRFRGFAQQPLNNAVMIHYLLYFKNLKMFEALYRARGENLASVIDAVRQAAPVGGDPFEAVRALLNRDAAVANDLDCEEQAFRREPSRFLPLSGFHSSVNR